MAIEAVEQKRATSEKKRKRELTKKGLTKKEIGDLQHGYSRLYGQRIGDEELLILAPELINHPRIRSLELGHNEIGPEGIETLITALENNTEVEILSLNSNPGIANHGAYKLAVFIEQHVRLKKLDLSYCNIRDEGAFALAAAIENHPSLEELDLSGNKIGNKGACALADAFRVNDHLRKVKLQFNKIGDDGAFALLTMLSVKPMLDLKFGAREGFQLPPIVPKSFSSPARRTVINMLSPLKLPSSEWFEANGFTIPDEFIDSFSLKLITNPVIDANGRTFQFENLEKWYRENDNQDPVTRETIESPSMIPNIALRQAIARFAEECIAKVQAREPQALTDNSNETITGPAKAAPAETAIARASAGPAI